ncbi:MAG: polyphosphate kinase 1, partial [Bdellovibrionales bacterium]|nr:polyphosphate kinase 1 [Bdellovibrionales bacterium]
MDGLNPKEQLKVIRQAVVPQIQRASQIYSWELKPSLHEAGVELLSWNELTSKEQIWAKEYFTQRIFPLLTPLAVDAGHPFPFMSNLSASLGVALSNPGRNDALFARVKISSIEPQWILLNPDSFGNLYRFVSVKELVLEHLSLFFPKMEILECMPFRITRNIALEVDEEESDDLRELMEEELRQRRKGMVVRLEHGPDPEKWILEFLREELDLHPHDVYEVSDELEYSSLRSVVRLPIADLKYKPWTPVTPPALREETSFFNLLRTRDILVHHPYESFSSSVERFVREAAEDPRVRSIKMTVYRVGDETPIIPLLIEAAARGKDVVCLVELKARFDERRNMAWAQKLEDAGVHVIYGIAGLKIHAKTLLVIRDEVDGIRGYAHIGTGNYHFETANLYTDLGLFTAKESYIEELIHFFHYLTGRSNKDHYEHLFVAPVNMSSRFLSLVERECEHHRSGRPAHIVAKMNNLEDREIIEALYRASQVGVKIDLIIRTVCCLRPGVMHLSENIRVISIVGRLLEHSRLYYFRNGQEEPADGEFSIGSADWMSRNLHRRVEVIAPVEERSHKRRLWTLLDLALNDPCLAWELDGTGSYTRHISQEEEDTLVSSQ